MKVGDYVKFQLNGNCCIGVINENTILTDTNEYIWIDSSEFNGVVYKRDITELTKEEQFDLLMEK